MNKNYFFTLLSLLGIFILSCSKNDVDELSENSVVNKIAVDYQPYISPSMQEILDMIDTCTTPIPIEKLIPYLNSSNDLTSENELALSTKSSSIEVVTGYDDASTLYSNVETVIDATQSDNFGISAGTYYVTCKAAYKGIITGGFYVSPKIYEDDIIGINPDNLTRRGYHVDEVNPADIYEFTTYIWGIAYGSSSEYIIMEWIPRSTGNEFRFASDFLDQIQWRYYAYQ
jgi:hypothetical protein